MIFRVLVYHSSFSLDLSDVASAVLRCGYLTTFEIQKRRFLLPIQFLSNEADQVSDLRKRVDSVLQSEAIQRLRQIQTADEAAMRISRTNAQSTGVALHSALHTQVFHNRSLRIGAHHGLYSPILN